MAIDMYFRVLQEILDSNNNLKELEKRKNKIMPSNHYFVQKYQTNKKNEKIKKRGSG